MLAVEKDNRIVGLALNQRNCQWDGNRLKERGDMVQCDPLRKLFYIWSIVSTEPQLHQKMNASCIFEVRTAQTSFKYFKLRCFKLMRIKAQPFDFTTRH